MAKLSEIYHLIASYLELYGDKDVTSIATWGGSGSQNQYTFHLHDIYEGSIGSNPYRGDFFRTQLLHRCSGSHGIPWMQGEQGLWDYKGPAKGTDRCREVISGRSTGKGAAAVFHGAVHD